MENIISIDLELSAPPGELSSILSLGASLVNDPDTHFYRELKPLSEYYVPHSVRVATRGLHCIPPKLQNRNEYNPHSRRFRPDLIMRYLSRHAASPEESFSEFLRWIKRSGGHLPSILAKPAKVDVKMIDLYFKRFSLPWPFFAVIDLEKTYAFVSHRNNLKELHVEDHRRYEHNALEDSIYQAEQYAAVLNIQKLALEKFFTNKNRNHHS